MAAPTVIIADLDGNTSSTVTAGFELHLRLNNRTYRNLRTTGLKWVQSAQRSGKTSWRKRDWAWTASGANASAYYVRYNSGNPALPTDTNRKWYANGVELTLGASVASLAVAVWAWDRMVG